MADYKIDPRIKLIEDENRDSKGKRRREQRLKRKEKTQLLGEKAGQNSDIFAGKKLHIGPLDTKTT
jgi:hypothetical protein